jgi:hypothetical protein
MRGMLAQVPRWQKPRLLAGHVSQLVRSLVF